MTVPAQPPLPPSARRAPAPPSSLLERWKDAEPVRLYVYGLLAALLVVLAAVGVVTQDLADALKEMLAAVLVAVPGAEAARASVYSPATVSAERLEDSVRWAAMIRAGRQ